MKKKLKRIAILTGGGDVPGLNSAMKQVVYRAKREGLEVVQWRLNMPSFSVYSQRVVERRRPQVGEVVMTTPAYLKELGPYDLLFVQNGIVLARLKPAPSAP